MNDQQAQMMINQAHIMNQPPLPHPPPLPQVMNQQPQLPVQSQLFLLNRGYVGNSNNNLNNNSNNNKQLKPWQTLQQNPSKIGTFGVSKPRSKNNANNWKGKKMKQSVGQGSTQGYNPPTLHELQSQNRQKTRKFYPNKKKFNNNGNNNNRFAPYAPRNTTSFIIRAKNSGGIASLVSPCPVTPAVLPTPVFSPSREVLGDMAKEEWGVDGYGSMKGLIRLRSGNELENEHDEEDDDDANGSSESDVEEHVEVERRLDHDLSRFEMIYPNYGGSGAGGDYNNVLENRVDDQDSHIAQLEEENLTLKERLFLMEREMADMRRRLLFLEGQHSNHRSGVCGEDVNEEVVENGSENESEHCSDVGEGKEHDNKDVYMELCVPNDTKQEEKEEKTIKNELLNEGMIAEEDGQRKVEKVGDQMDAEDEARTEEKEAGKGIQ